MILPIPCFNALRIPRLVDTLQDAGYEVVQGISRVTIQTKTDPPTREELSELQRLTGTVMNMEI